MLVLVVVLAGRAAAASKKNAFLKKPCRSIFLIPARAKGAVAHINSAYPTSGGKFSGIFPSNRSRSRIQKLPIPILKTPDPDPRKLA